ncbi:flagellar hook-associated protein FlgK [Dechloromonas sp. A34]|uniref:flagellar hook-associated protein FlgK n=1 Tax=Dechloromonas sp. A34 TaxID=447588 RepID=UPI002248C501|nr:flagellar hook-associated protein FlgK [Dechloromonas sp. A34]
MSTGIFSVGISGIAAAQLGLLTTEHNVVNASTPGYTRQRTVQATNLAVNTGAGSIGQGVHVQTIERLYDRFLTGQVTSAQSSLSEIEAYYTEIKQIDNLLADPSAGLSPALQDFFSGVQQVASNPSLLSARQSMISSAQTLVSRFQSIDARLSDLTSEVNGKIQDAVSSVNSYATQIADLNQRILVSESSYGQPANDLLDQRDQLINDLNKLIKVSTTTNSDGGFNVFIGSGQQLVVGNIAMRMSSTMSSADPEKMVVGLETANGGVQELPERLIVGGELGGLVKFRSESLDRATNELGRLAASVALTFNAQHALGQDLLGQANGDAGFNADFFSVGLLKPEVSANANNDNTGTPVIQAAFAPPTYGPEVNNGNFFTKLTTSDYQLANTATGYTLTRLSDNKQWGPSALGALSTTIQSEEGFSISLSGADAVGNRYLIRPTESAAKNLAINPVVAADTRMVAAATPFRTSAAGSNTGSGIISSGTGVPGFNTSLLPAAGITISYASATTQLSLAGVTAGQTITYKPPGAAEVSVVAPATIPYTQGMAVAVSGMSFVISGVPGNGDTFKLERNTAATSDGRNALAIGKLQTQNTVAGGSATFQTAYAELVANNGVKTRELKVTGEAQQAVLDQAQANRDALSGVNLDEEAANMIRFQQAYQASAKLLEVGKTLFDTILQIS